MFRSPLVASAVIALGGLLLAGCGPSSDVPKLAPVHGVVTMDGKPLANATVRFIPESGRPSVGVTDEQGRYELNYTDEQPI